MNVSIIIPVKNEEKSIVSVIKKIRTKIKTSFETFIIYDDPSDLTKTTAEKFIKDNKIKNFYVVRNNSGNKIGVINAIKTGIKQSKGNAIVITMADLSDDISQIDEMYNLITKGYDLISASRYMPGGKKFGGPVVKSFLSKTAGTTLRIIFKVPTHDATNAYKMYRRQLFKTIKIESTGGFEYSLEILLKAYKKGFKITEIPTVWHDREEGKSNFKLLRWIPKYIKTYLLVIKSK